METRMEEDLFDFVLKHALEDVVSQEVAEIETQPSADSAPSDTLIHFAKKCVRKRKAALFVQHLPANCRRVAAFIVVAFAAFAAVLMTTPPVQAASYQVCMQWTAKYAVFEFQTPVGETSEASALWEISELPQGFEITSSDTESYERMIEYHNQQGERILFIYTDIPNYNTSIDTERHYYSEYDLNDTTVCLMLRTDNTSFNIALWHSNSYTFQILTTLPEENLKELVKNVRKV